MKTKIIVALVVAAALCTIVYVVVSNGICNPPLPHKKDVNIVGAWKIDSIYNNKDSGSLSLLVYALADSNTMFQFNADSTLQISSPTTTEMQYYVLNKDSLIIKQDSTLETSIVTFQSDSLVSITNKDSTVLVLKRTGVK